jgi:hypothetical protein
MIRVGEVYSLADECLYLVVSVKRMSGTSVAELLRLDGALAGTVTWEVEARMLINSQWKKTT